MLIQSISHHSSMEAYSQKSSLPCADSILFAPCNLIGRVCEHWREIALIAATALSVIGFILSFLSASLFMCMIFALIGSITLIEAGEMRDLGTLHDVSEGLKEENNTYKLNNLRHHMQVQALTAQVNTLTEQNVEYQTQNQAHVQANEQQQKINTEFVVQIETFKGSLGEIKNTAEVTFALLKEKGLDSIQVKQSVESLIDKIAQSNLIQESIEKNIKENYKDLAQTVSKELMDFYSIEVKKSMIEETNARKKELQELLNEIQTRRSEAATERKVIESQIEHLGKEKEFVESQTQIAKKSLEALLQKIGDMDKIVKQELQIQNKVDNTLTQVASIAKQTNDFLTMRTGNTPNTTPIRGNNTPQNARTNGEVTKFNLDASNMV